MTPAERAVVFGILSAVVAVLAAVVVANMTA